MSNKKNIALLLFGMAAGVGLAWLVRRQRSQPVRALSAWQQYLTRRYGTVKAQQIFTAIQQRYAALLGEQPQPEHPALRWHLVENILPGLALYQVLLQEHSNDRQVALAEVDEAFRAWTINKSRLMLAPLQILPNAFPLFRRVFSRRMQAFPAEGWDFDFIENSPDRIAFNGTRCFYLKTLTACGAHELTPAFCKTDEVMAELFPPSIRFVRTKTLGRGDAVCDFQYCRGTTAKPIQISLSMSSIFLLPCQDGYLQIDAGYDHDYPIYRRNLARAGITLESIRYLVLTHHHDDHAGFLNELTRDTDTTIIAHEQAAALLKNGQNDKSRGGGYVNGFIKLVAGLKMRFDPRWTLTFPPFTLRESDILLTGDDNQVLRQMGVPGQILYTPGHCIDHIAVVLDSGEAFCGDAAASFLLWAGTRYCTVFMTDMDEAYRSWQKMLAAGARVIYPAHGRPFPSCKLRQNMGRIKTEALAKFL